MPHAARAPATRRMRDAALITTARGLRSFGYGLLSVLLGVALSTAGFSPVAIGAHITVSLVGDVCGTYVIGLYADRWGRQHSALLQGSLLVLGLLFVVAGALKAGYDLTLWVIFRRVDTGEVEA